MLGRGRLAYLAWLFACERLLRSLHAGCPLARVASVVPNCGARLKKQLGVLVADQIEAKVKGTCARACMVVFELLGDGASAWYGHRLVLLCLPTPPLASSAVTTALGASNRLLPAALHPASRPRLRRQLARAVRHLVACADGGGEVVLLRCTGTPVAASDVSPAGHAQHLHANPAESTLVTTEPLFNPSDLRVRAPPPAMWAHKFVALLTAPPSASPRASVLLVQAGLAETVFTLQGFRRCVVAPSAYYVSRQAAVTPGMPAAARAGTCLVSRRRSERPPLLTLPCRR